MMLSISSFPNLPGITVTPFQPVHLDHVHAVIHEIGPRRLGTDLTSWENGFSEAGYFWTVIANKTPVAFAGMSFPVAGVAYLHGDLVRPDFQGKGIGTVLVLTRLAALDESEVELIGVVATQFSAPFYQRFGFRLENEPEFDSYLGFEMHQMSMPYTRKLRQASENVLEGLENVRFESPEGI